MYIYMNKISYLNKYLKYKYKYLKLLGGSGKGTYDPKENRCVSTVVNSKVQRKIYSINFLWLNRNIETSYRLQQYIFPFKNQKVSHTEIISINLEYIKNILNIIKWSQKNPTAVINIWHDSNPTMVDNTKQLIHNLLNYDKLIIEFETLFIIITNINLLKKYLNKEQEFIEQIICDKLTNQYLNINRKLDNPKIIDSYIIKQEFMDKMKEAGIMTSQVHNRNDINSCVKDFQETLPNLDLLEKELVCMPVGWWLKEEDLRYIIKKCMI